MLFARPFGSCGSCNLTSSFMRSFSAAPVSMQAGRSLPLPQLALFCSHILTSWSVDFRHHSVRAEFGGTTASITKWQVKLKIRNPLSAT